jgi:Tol biopolymer transport system component
VRAGAGPWLVYWAGQDVFSSAESCRTLSTPERRVTNPYNDLALAPSPSGEWIALLTSNIAESAARYFYADLALELVHLPDCQRRSLSSLLNTKIQNDLRQPYVGDAPTAIFAVRENLPPKWSPDGRWLAFAAALDGDSAELYTYDLTEQKLRRLSNSAAGASQESLHVRGFWWSPDSRWLVYRVGLPPRPHFDALLTATYAVEPDGHTNNKLYDVFFDIWEPFYGWGPDHTFFVEHGSVGLTQFSLRSFNVDTGQQTALLEDWVYSAATDPRSGTVAFIVSDTASNRTLAPGVYVVTLGGERRAVYLKPATMVFWSAALKRFVVETKSEGVLTLTLNGEQTFFSGETLDDGRALAVAADGTLLAFADNSAEAQKAHGDRSGIRLYAPNGTRQSEFVTGNVVRQIAFSPDSKRLAYTLDEASGGYYLLRIGERTATRVAVPDAVRALGWVAERP